MGRPLKTMKSTTKDLGYPNFSDREAPVKNSANTLNNNQYIGVVGGDGLTSSANSLDVDSTVVRTTGTQTIAGAKTFSDSAIFNGDLTVNGTTTTINSTTVSTGDNIIVLNSDVTGTPTENAGIEVERGDSTNKQFQWNETTDRWVSDSPLQGDGFYADTTQIVDGSGNWVGPNSGLKGEVGPQGPQGQKGATGAQGPQGSTGPTGPSGNPFPGGTFSGDITTKNIIATGPSGTYNVGSSSVKFGTMYANTFNGTATSAQYADLAERYESDKALEPGTVVCFGGEKEVTACAEASHHSVAGVVSTNPAHLMNAEAGDDNSHPAIALAGRVPVKVVGPVNKGDLLVSSDVEGRAKADNKAEAGRILGKAMESANDGEHVIEALINLM